MNENKYIVLLVFIFLLAAFFRLYGINWDQDQHLHPDERFLTMVANGISWPKNIGEYFDTAMSPLNPHNRGFGFFVYGTFPVFLTKWIAEGLGNGDYTNLTIIGRELSAFADLGTVMLVFLIAKEINSKLKVQNSIQAQSSKSKKKSKYFGFGIWDFVCHLDFGIWTFPLLSMFLYSIMVLPIQLSHFYAVDTYLTFFITLSFYLLIRIIITPKTHTTYYLLLATFLGVSFGLALASKISAVLFLPIIGLGLLTIFIKTRNIKMFSVSGFLFLVACFITFRLAQPYAFANGNFFDLTLNQKVLNNWKQLESFNNPNGWYPPGVQWITTKPYLFPLKNMILWGLGLPLGIISILGIFFSILAFLHFCVHAFKKRQLTINFQQLIIFLSLLWIFILFIYQGSQFSKNMRYFYPIYPFLAIISGYFIVQIFNKFKIGLPVLSKVEGLGYWIIGLLVFIYPLSFLSIYSQQHSRVTASAWIYNNIPAGSTIAGEQWDDFLPVSLPPPGYIHEKYIGIEFTPYAVDTVAKWKDMEVKLQKVDYIILSSNRLYGSIMTVPGKYPVTNRYYSALFDGSLGFEKIAEFTSRPNISLPLIHICLTPPFARYGNITLKYPECPLPGISFVDDYADESFTVYDHPKVIIFKKIKPVDYFNFLYNQK